MTDVPTPVKYGRVTGYFTSFVADTDNDVPDEVPLSGTVTLTPLTAVTRWPTTAPPRLAFPQRQVCPVVDGTLCSPDTTTPDVWLVATDQPEGQPDRIQWKARFDLPSGGWVADVVFDVPADGVVDLALVATVPPAPGTIVVVSHQDAVGAAASADAAAQSAEAAANSAAASAGADVSAAEAAASATAAAGSASTAQSSASAAQVSQASAATSASTADTDAASAVAAADAAGISADQASSAASSADTDAVSANDSATAAGTSATNASSSATAAATGASQAATSASDAANSALLAGAYFKTVPTASGLPAASGNTGRSYYVIDTAVVVLSDGTRWRTVYGDTGLRNVSSMITDPGVAASPLPIARLRRYGNTVEFYVDAKWSAAPASPFKLIDLPVGFRPSQSKYAVCWVHGVPGALRTVYDGVAAVNVYSAGANVQDRMSGMWMTSDAWPATLPGIAALPPN